MRSPILIAETSDEAGPRLLAPPGRGLELAMARHYLDLARETGDDVEEIEGEDYLAVRLALANESTGQPAPLFLVLAGIHVDRLSDEERDEILNQLRERAEVLGDAVAAQAWAARPAEPLAELPELDEWHEPAWDLLPRAGLWAEQPPIQEPEPSPETAPIAHREQHASLLTPSQPPAAAIQPVITVPDLSAPAAPNETPRGVTPGPVAAPTASNDHSPALAHIAHHASHVSPTASRRSIGWRVFPWAALALLIAGDYLYVTEMDRTWNQHVTESRFAQGATRVIEKPVEVVVEKIVDRVVEKPVERIVEKMVVKEVPASPGAPSITTDQTRADQWARFQAEYQARLGRGEVTRAAEHLAAWAAQLPAWTPQTPPGLAGLQQDFRTAAGPKLREWSLARARQARRFADAREAVDTFVAAPAVTALLTAPVAGGIASAARTEVRAAEDEFHYERIRTLANQPGNDDQLKTHLLAYVALFDPPGRMAAEVRQLIEYRAWLAGGRPARATVRITWGPRTVPADHQVELTFGPAAPVVRTVSARPGDTWNETIVTATSGTRADGRIPYRIKTIRPATAVEALAEGGAERTEVFALAPEPGGPIEAADEPDSGTKVMVEWAGQLVPPVLPPWPGATDSLPKKVGP